MLFLFSFVLLHSHKIQFCIMEDKNLGQKIELEFAYIGVSVLNIYPSAVMVSVMFVREALIVDTSDVRECHKWYPAYAMTTMDMTTERR